MLKLPLEVWYTDNKKFILNLNNYRNAHYRVLNEAKVQYKMLVMAALQESGWDGTKFERCKVTFVYSHPNKRRNDKSNPCSIIEKFACDALTELKVWDDDDSEHIPETAYVYAGVEKGKDFCQLIIEEM